MEPELIDIHCHLNFPEFNEDREEVIERTLKEKVWFIVVGTHLDSSKKALEIAKNYNGINSGFNAGRFCWKVAGTLCTNFIQGRFAKNIMACQICPFFEEVRRQEGARLG